MELPKGKRLILDILKAKKIATTLCLDMELRRKGYFISDRVLIKHIVNLEKHSPFIGYGYVRAICGRPYVVVLAREENEMDYLLSEARKLKLELSYSNHV